MKRDTKHHGLVFLVLLISAPLLVSAGAVDNSVGIASSNGDVWVLDARGMVVRLDPTGREELSSFDVSATEPTDVGVDAAGNIVIADNHALVEGVIGARLLVYSPRGALLRTIPFEGGFPQRVVRSNEGNTNVLVYGPDNGFRIRRFRPDYSELPAIPVGTACTRAGSAWPFATLAIDREGNFWVGEMMGCGSDYTIRRYSSEGEFLGDLKRTHQFASSESGHSRMSNVAVLTELIPDQGRMLAILGKLLSNGHLVVDVWNVDDGAYVTRAALPGFDTPLVRAVITEGHLLTAGRNDTQRIRKISLSELRKNVTP